MLSFARFSFAHTWRLMLSKQRGHPSISTHPLHQREIENMKKGDIVLLQGSPRLTPWAEMDKRNPLSLAHERALRIPRALFCPGAGKATPKT